MEARRAEGCESVAGGQHQDEVGCGAELRVAPRGGDRDLRDRCAEYGDPPPPRGGANGDEPGRDEDEDPGEQPEGTAGRSDRLPQLCDLGPSEALRDSEEVDESVARQYGHHDPPDHGGHEPLTPSVAGFTTTSVTWNGRCRPRATARRSITAGGVRAARWRGSSPSRAAGRSARSRPGARTRGGNHRPRDGDPRCA